ncbi:MAG: phosphoribosylaminoimidazolesuccinocarboxamide synthase [Planctomycetes bacterium]|nr:phosphoribosylaminoimidazolesuccinocarboxamide synthase [Planctomycetota bacterium]
MSAKPVVTQTDLPGYRLLGRGKVRDIYDLDDKLLIVATDRLSAFDVVNPVGIPEKGRVLTALSAFWFRLLADITDTHLITDQVAEMGHGLERFADVLQGRSMLVHRTAPIRVECVVRGYLAGSAWSEYRKAGRTCGIQLPAGLVEASQLAEPLFTPAIKAETGHDENISFAEAARILGDGLAATLRDRSIALYNRAAAYARQRGIIIADTKFEWGQRDGKLLLIDEAFTPDSSRFWPLDGYQPGRGQPSFDKQPVRDWLEATGWDKTPPAPPLPPEVVRQTTERYLEALRRLTQ